MSYFFLDICANCCTFAPDMRKWLVNILLVLAASVSAVNIPQGVIYFDNTKTNYANVQFVYGKESAAESYVYNMSKTATNGLWSIVIPSTVTDMYRYTFSNTTLSEGYHNQNFPDLKEYISHTLNSNRTATTDAYITAGYVFVPESSENWAQGSWMSYDAWKKQQSGGGGGSVSGPFSGTLPVFYIRTENNAAITSKENYINATLYMDPLNTGYGPLASASAPLDMQIKGRGNYTWWGFDKKPYKIKFVKKQQVLGLPANKHWCLLAHPDDGLGYLKNAVGFRIAQLLDMRWTPHQVPVELMLNGQYQGLYFLTEHVRIAKNRINIQELEDNCSNPDSITGGWLVEIDNYEEDGNITFTEGNGQDVMITPKSPEILSYAERNYATAQLNNLNQLLYGSSESALQAVLDFDEAAKFYLVQEIMEDCESYHGSCFLYKDRDVAGQPQQKWYFGPVWDFGNSYIRHDERFIYDNPTWSQIWIGQLATWPAFQTAVKKQWYIFYHYFNQRIKDYINEYASRITTAATYDAKKWNGTQNYQNNSNMSSKKNDFLNRYNWRINWLYSQWGEGIQTDYVPTALDQLAIDGANNQPAPFDPFGDNIGVDFFGDDAASDSANRKSQITNHKLLINGQLFIQRGDELYNATGARVR